MGYRILLTQITFFRVFGSTEVHLFLSFFCPTLPNPEDSSKEFSLGHAFKGDSYAMYVFKKFPWNLNLCCHFLTVTDDEVGDKVGVNAPLRKGEFCVCPYLATG